MAIEDAEKATGTVEPEIESTEVEEEAPPEGSEAASEDSDQPKPPPKQFKSWEDYWKAEYKREKRKRQELQGRSVTQEPKKAAGPDPDEEILKTPDDKITTVEQLRRKIALELKKELSGEFSDAAKTNRLV